MAGRHSPFAYRDRVAKKTSLKTAPAERGAPLPAPQASLSDKRAPQASLSPRRPCECGSGRRWKNCHGGADAGELIVPRPFAGMASEVELIALREFVPSATAPLTLSAPADDSPSVTLCTVLPGAAAALTRSDGSVLVGLQTQVHSGDLARDLGASLQWALAAAPSSMLPVPPQGPELPRLADLVVDSDLYVTVHDSFAWWLENSAEEGSEVALSLEQANQAIMPTAKLTGLPGAYWVDAGEKAHLRWVRPEEETAVMAALARLSAAGELDLGEGSRYVGSFRAHGRLVPVWDLDRDAHPTEWEAPAAAFAERYDAAVSSAAPLTDAERRARDGILGRQFTLR